MDNFKHAQQSAGHKNTIHPTVSKGFWFYQKLRKRWKQPDFDVFERFRQPKTCVKVQLKTIETGSFLEITFDTGIVDP